MPIAIQCPNASCRSQSIVPDAIAGRGVKCKKCGTPFKAVATLDGMPTDTKPRSPSSGVIFPILPAEFGRYRVLSLLGKGGMGAVYLAEDTQLGRKVALKLPSFDVSETKRLERFVREAKASAGLQHPNICAVHDAGVIAGRPFISMAYIAGKTLDVEIDPDQPMDAKRAVEIVRKIALALQEAHENGIVHRDLKPANVMMSAKGEPVVMDFGLAKNIGELDENESKLTQQGAVMGTPSYMSPEQVRGDIDQIGPATDIYALGVMLFEMLTSRTPYGGPVFVVMAQILTSPVPRLREFRPDADVRLETLCEYAMAKDIFARPASMAIFAAKLAEYLQQPDAIPAIATFVPNPQDEDFVVDKIVLDSEEPLPFRKVPSVKARPSRKYEDEVPANAKGLADRPNASMKEVSKIREEAIPKAKRSRRLRIASATVLGLILVVTVILLSSRTKRGDVTVTDKSVLTQKQEDDNKANEEAMENERRLMRRIEEELDARIDYERKKTMSKLAEEMMKNEALERTLKELEKTKKDNSNTKGVAAPESEEDSLSLCKLDKEKFLEKIYNGRGFFYNRKIPIHTEVSVVGHSEKITIAVPEKWNVDGKETLIHTVKRGNSAIGNVEVTTNAKDKTMSISMPDYGVRVTSPCLQVGLIRVKDADGISYYLAYPPFQTTDQRLEKRPDPKTEPVSKPVVVVWEKPSFVNDIATVTSDYRDYVKNENDLVFRGTATVVIDNKSVTLTPIAGAPSNPLHKKLSNNESVDKAITLEIGNDGQLIVTTPLGIEYCSIRKVEVVRPVKIKDFKGTWLPVIQIPKLEIK